MKESRNSYRNIVKATSIFGGVQIFNILISIVRTKFIAVYIGPAGLGIAGLFLSTINLVGSFTNFGLGTSGVKDVALANGTTNNIRIARIIKVLKRMIFFTGLLGMLFMIVFSQALSKLAFGNINYTLSFIWISIVLLFNQLTTGQLVILQGLRKLNYLAKANIVGSAIGLLLTFPIYYYYHVDGIVPSMIIAAIVSFATSRYFSKKIIVEKIKVSKLRIYAESKSMMISGFMISLSGIITLGCNYITQIYISKTGGIEQVGLFSAGFAIVNTYVSLIFTAMATDYYPRLSSVSKDNNLCKKEINQQAEIAILVLSPILLIFMVFIKLIIIILYSKKFVEIDSMLHWIAIGILFKAVTWSIGFIFLAKGDTRTFLWNELTGNFYMLCLTLVGYSFFGLKGVGIAFAVGFVFYLCQIYLVARFKYNMSFNKSFIKIFFTQVILALSSVVIINLFGGWLSYTLCSLIIILSGTISFFELNKRIGIMSFIKKK
ncbi:O-antigen translocase [Flavobacterium sp. S87F.05.LMB.W.Kidney.N]|uniref:O-antigen translocase n=1 Tax=Flavobacterium sp. S87F.05.LMB.W.Kidney.N TaxID=1278758 RepID=UPI001064F3CE|nr:O-antigen translocase [Flavobacterium sp. S87F.05.LMB.W.Kidney.N]TDX09273.1 O-antigen/teichoic acid export membrane protein [Flavobacterium sp. S87F.05.LMB.W.Kidney.N]